MERDISKSPEPQNTPIDASSFLARFKTRTHFREQDGRMGIGHDVIGMVRRLASGGVETYTEKLKREAEKGSTEAASYGKAHLHGHPFVLSAMHWEFFTGTLGVVAGEKFMKGADLAAENKLPAVNIYSSGGARQQENFPALSQMARVSYAIEESKKESGRPHVAVLVRDVWGGISASAVPRADITVALKGTGYGFAGPNVIRSYTKTEVPPGSQTAESNVSRRNLDMLFPDEPSLMKWLEKFLAMDETLRRSQGGKVLSTLQNLPPILHSSYNRFNFTDQGVITPDFDNDAALMGRNPRTDRLQKEPPIHDPQTLHQRYESLRKDFRRPDTEYILAHAFTDVVPLFSFGYKPQYKMLDYPPIIAALGKIGEQPFLIIGNQPKYQGRVNRETGEINPSNKIPASPEPADFKYAQRMLEFGERVGYPVVFITDTLGAKPTLEAEAADQSRAIADTILKTNTYKHPIISIVIGGLGSGGGLATTPFGDHIAATERAMVFVAEPESAASILYRKPDPSREEIGATIDSMRATAQDQLELGIIDAVIKEPPGGAQENPLRGAELIRNHIAETAFQLLSQPDRRRLRIRDHRLRNLRGIPLVNNEKTTL